eukprot:TRINITY_DN9205_c0_g1_i1.p1 TRINITY_DN9205_c0_g1~~TRINITY_DN9205_c0_g1_i1.p1  ORF type:complete len:679 (+),score=129.63 TRINITY_DN9205_c0_g1_i1:46-2082(+)
MEAAQLQAQAIVNAARLEAEHILEDTLQRRERILDKAHGAAKRIVNAARIQAAQAKQTSSLDIEPSGVKHRTYRALNWNPNMHSPVTTSDSIVARKLQEATAAAHSHKEERRVVKKKKRASKALKAQPDLSNQSVTQLLASALRSLTPKKSKPHRTAYVVEGTPPLPLLVREWGIPQVLQWLQELPLSRDYAPLITANYIIGTVLLTMTTADWRTLGVPVAADIQMLDSAVGQLIQQDVVVFKAQNRQPQQSDRMVVPDYITGMLERSLINRQSPKPARDAPSRRKSPVAEERMAPQSPKHKSAASGLAERRQFQHQQQQEPKEKEKPPAKAPTIHVDAQETAEDVITIADLPSPLPQIVPERATGADKPRRGSLIERRQSVTSPPANLTIDTSFPDPAPPSALPAAPAHPPDAPIQPPTSNSKEVVQVPPKQESEKKAVPVQDDEPQTKEPTVSTRVPAALPARPAEEPEEDEEPATIKSTQDSTPTPSTAAEISKADRKRLLQQRARERMGIDSPVASPVAAAVATPGREVREPEQKRSPQHQLPEPVVVQDIKPPTAVLVKPAVTEDNQDNASTPSSALSKAERKLLVLERNRMSGVWASSPVAPGSPAAPQSPAVQPPQQQPQPVQPQSQTQLPGEPSSASPRTGASEITGAEAASPASLARKKIRRREPDTSI